MATADGGAEVPDLPRDARGRDEVAGDAAVLNDPQEVGQLQEAVRTVLIDGTLRRGLRARSLEQARRFSLERMARKTVKVYERVASGPA